MKRFHITLALFLSSFYLHAQTSSLDRQGDNGLQTNKNKGQKEFISQTNKHEVLYEPVSHNWFGQLALDMSLQNPYGHPFHETFPNGRTFGINAAIGRWFTPEIGLRLRINWENGIRVFENPKANWLPPFNQPGINMDKGGYITFVGDIPFDIHNIVFGYSDSRIWNLALFPRAGVAYNFGVAKGSPLIGLGMHNRFRVADHLNLFFDMAYQFVSSGFQTSDKPTGTGTGSNGFADANIGIQYNIGKSGFHHLEKKDANTPMMSRSFKEGWFFQAGLDMTLHKPYRQHFNEVFPKGRTMGFEGAIGRFFSDEIAARVHVNWENGFPLFKNKKLEWVAPGGANGINMDKGGYVNANLDIMLSSISLIKGVGSNKTWDILPFARAGIGSNLATKSASPVVGAGIEGVYHFKKRLGIYADISYNAITSEFYEDVSVTGMSVSTGHNGFFEIGGGIMIGLGKQNR